MQSFLFFCEECGAANSAGSENCVACQQPLAFSLEALPAEDAQPAQPVQVITPPALSVVAGAPAVSGITASGMVTTATSTGKAAPLRPGTLLAGRYRIARQIGEGGFGLVYKARDKQYKNMLVAIKEIDMSALAPREVIEATDTFNREVALFSPLNYFASHNHSVPRMYDHFTDAQHWYIVMEYVDGITLEDYLKQLRRGYLPERKALQMATTLADVLHYLHSCKPSIIFRDVKPGNVLITPEGRLCLIDFGIARRYTPDKHRDTCPLGSPGYAAPEQYGLAQTDARTDVYGLGATLQTLLLGREPLELQSGMPPRRAKPLPLDLQRVLDAMLERDAMKRPRSMKHARALLQKSLLRMEQTYFLIRGAFLGLGLLLWLAFTLAYFPLMFGSVKVPIPAIFYMLGATLACLWPFGAFLCVVVGLTTLFVTSKRYMGVILLLAVMLSFLLMVPLYNFFAFLFHHPL